LVRARGLQPGDLNDITYNDVNRGWVRIGFLWDDSEMIWLINGNPVVKDNLLMPNEARMYMLLTREISDVISGGTVDPTSAENRQLLANDRVKIRYIRVWEVNYQNPPRTMDNNPRQPGQVRGFPLSNTTVRLKWNASENAEKYNLYRDDAYITTVFGTQFDDSNLSPDTAYRYEVEALRDGRPASVRSCVAIVNTW